MGNQKNSAGKRVFNDTFALPQDLQDLADDIYEFSGFRIGTSAERQSAPSAQLRPGVMWSELDTGFRYQWDGSGWVSAGGRAYARMARGTSQTIPNTTFTKVTWPTEADPPVGITYSAGDFTVPAAGRYLITAQLAYDTPNTSGQRVIRIRRNGDVLAQSTQVIPNATYPALPQVTITATCNAGDVLYVETYQSSGANRTAGVDAASSFISIDKVS